MDFLLLCILFLVIGYIIYATTRSEITYCDPTEIKEQSYVHRNEQRNWKQGLFFEANP